MTTPTAALSAIGVSIWLDDLSRDRIQSGGLEKLIAEKNVVGVTTNPTIFAGALAKGTTYDTQVGELAKAGTSVTDAVFEITTDDVAAGCDIFRSVYDSTNGQDGRVSIEVEPGFAHDAAATIEQGTALFAKVDRPNVMIKVPATVEGLEAITALTAEGVSVNVTLIFSLQRHRDVIDAYLTGLEQAKAAGKDLSTIHSVASFFVSRVDTEIDKRLEAIGTPEALALKSKAGVANAQLAYQVFEQEFASDRAKALLAAGANAQRPLWASTGVKDPNLPDTLYVTELAVANVVNTMPEKTLEATFDHGVIDGDAVTGSYAAATEVLDAVAAQGVSYDEVTALLEKEGVEKFIVSWNELLDTVSAALEAAEMSIKLHVTGAAAEAADRIVPQLVSDLVASRITGQDSTLWGADAESEATVRLGWVESVAVSGGLIDDIVELREKLVDDFGVDHFVLGGMGGSSLAPEVITQTQGVELTVLDSTDPAQVLAAVSDRLATTAVIISSKSGGTVETDSQKRTYEKAFRDAGIDPLERIIVVTDPGSPLDVAARSDGYRVFNADPNVGGRYSALTAFGLVPSGLAGVDIRALLDEADAAMFEPANDNEQNPGLILGAAIAGTVPLKNKLGIVADGTHIVGFGDWVEQLIAESTGKIGRGLLPVVLGTDAPELTQRPDDLQIVRLVGDFEDTEHVIEGEIEITGTLGAQMLTWEYATAVAGRLLGINPFDQPDVESAKIATRGLLDNRPEPVAPAFVDNGIEVRGTDDVTSGATDLAGVVSALLSFLGSDGYLSVQAYLDRNAHDDLASVRDSLAARAQRPVTFGWGPRFLHSTGQFHKGGPAIGVFLQITSVGGADLEIPDRPFTFGQLIQAQAAGDASVLAEHGRPVLTLTLTNPAEQLPALIAALA